MAAGLLTSSAGAHMTHPCPCRHTAGVAQPGEVACVDVYGRRTLARCEMVLNNSSWRFLGTPCAVTAKIEPQGGG
jgi:hypothetical protein